MPIFGICATIKTIAELFELQAKKHADRTAVVYEKEKLTYKELNEKAERLAGRLEELGVGADDFVVIMAERSLEMIIGMYGVLKSGGAYVPVDPTYPEERIQYMLEDCKPKAVLVYKAEIETEVPVIDLADSRVWESAPKSRGVKSTPENLAYCIYTSGTTGKPKGVMIKQKNVVNYVTGREKSTKAI